MSTTITASTHVWYLFAALAGCHRGASPALPAPAAAASPASSPERGPAAPISKLTLDVAPSLKGSRNAVLRTGDKVVTGDGINIAITTSVDAHLYVGYCDRNSKLTIFPPQGSIEAKAEQITYAPDKDADIMLDDQIGLEVLYVIASRRRLDLADPELAAAISRSRPGAATAECGQPLQEVLEKKKPAPPPVPPRGRPEGGARARPVADNDRMPPPADLERGGYIRWGTAGSVSAGGDRDDIVVLRYSFTHVGR